MRYRELLTESMFGFYQDNPALKWEGGKDWVKRKQEDAELAKEHTTAYKGISYYLLRGSVTATMGGQETMFFPVKVLKHIPGCMDEARRPGEPQFDALLKRIEKDGYDFDRRHAVLVGVNHKGNAYIIEGNTRTAVAAHLGIPYIPVEFRWFNGAEMTPSIWQPQDVAGLGESSPNP